MFRQVAAYMDNKIERRLDRRGFSLEAVLVFVCGLLGSIGFAYVWMTATNEISNFGDGLTYEFLASVLAPILVLFGLWIWYTVGAHLLASHYRGRGPIIRLFRTTAWALVPIGIWYLIRSAVIVVLFFSVDMPENPSQEAPGIGASATHDYIMGLGLEDPIYIGTLLLGVAFTVWSGYLLSTAVQRSKNIEQGDARKVGGVLSGAFALYLVWSALGYAGIA